jgi:hypothetical protein
MLFSFPGALVFGIRGIIHDRPRLLAIITTIISAGVVSYLCFQMFIAG